MYGVLALIPRVHLLFWGDPAANYINNVYTSNPFIVPNPFPTSFTSKTAQIPGMMSVTNKTWFSTFYQGYPPAISDKTYSYFDRFGRVRVSLPLLTTNKYNVGGHHGISAEKDNKSSTRIIRD